MSEQKQALKLDAKIHAEDQLYDTMVQRASADRRLMLFAMGGAIFAHLVVLAINFPDFKTILPQKEKRVIVVKKYVPPPPQVERKEIIQQQVTRKVPIPDPTPDEPEPIREPEPEIAPEPLPQDVDILIGTPEPPPPTGPLLAGVGDVTNPVLIDQTRVQPEYPELARQARLTGNVILQAVITRTGTVEEIKVLRVDKPNLGFEDAAIFAVQQWRYKPATQNGKPVDVYFTINVSFTLH